MKTKRMIQGIALCMLVCCAASCRRVGPLTLAPPGSDGREGEVTMHYFFDRTASMKGFTAKGDDADYVEALKDIWDAASVFPLLDAHFYEFGETYTHEFNSLAAIKQIQRELHLGEFYGGNQKGAGGIRTLVKQNNGQPFSAVADYIKTQNTPDSVYVILTDLYEQGRDDPFSRLYREAFARGMSGAFFAIESSFSGSIYSISRVDIGGATVNVRDGYSTFFVCVVGESRALYKYCASLTKELNRGNSLQFDGAVFMLNAISRHDLSAPQSELITGEQVMAGNTKRFEADENVFKRVNVRTEPVRIAGETGGTSVEAYQLLTNTGSRWAAGLPLANVNPANFSYTSAYTLLYNESGSSPRDSEPLSFTGIANSTDITVKLVAAADITEPAPNIPLYVAIEARNSRLKKGWYNVKYTIVPQAVTRPAWVNALNAENIAALQESAKGKDARVKTLQLANVYEKIAEAYNALKSKSIYKDEIYLLKR